MGRFGVDGRLCGCRGHVGQVHPFCDELPCWADLCRPSDVFTCALGLQDVCLFHGMPAAARGVPGDATAARAEEADKPGCCPGAAATAEETAYGNLQLRTCGAHFLDHALRCTSPEAIQLLVSWARVADPLPAPCSAPPAVSSGSGDAVVGACSTTERQRRLGCTPTSSSTVTGLDYRPPIWSGRWFDAPPRLLRTVARGSTAFPLMDVAGVADAQRRNARRRGGRHSRSHGQPVGDERVGRRTCRDESSSSSSSSRRSGSVGETTTGQSSGKDNNLSDGASDETRSDMTSAYESSWQPPSEHLRPYTRAEISAFERRTQFGMLSATKVWVVDAATAFRGSSARANRHYGGGGGRGSSVVEDTQGASQYVGGRGGGRPGDALTLVDRAMCLVAQAHVCSFEQLWSTYGMANGGGVEHFSVSE